MSTVAFKSGIIYWTFSRGDDTDIAITNPQGWDDYQSIQLDIKTRRDIRDKAILSLSPGNGLSISGNQLLIALTSQQTAQLNSPHFAADLRLRIQGKVLPPVPFILNVTQAVTFI
jgi:hypothetical protein